MNELFGQILDRDPSIVFVKDHAGIVRYGNAAFLELFAPGRRAAVIGSRLDNFSSDDPSVVAKVGPGGADRMPSDAVQAVTDWAGRVRVFRLRHHAIETASGDRYVLAIGADMTDLAGREDDLAKAGERVRQWASMVAHDILAPLGSYPAAIQLIESDPESVLGVQSSQYLELISTSASNLVHQMTAMLQRERDDDLQGEMDARCDLNLCMAEVRAGLAPLLTHARAVLSTTRLPTIKGERASFRRLFTTLIENSIRRRQLHDPRIVIRHEQSEETHFFCIEDNGRAMSADAKDALAEPHADGALIGIGIGLAQCQRAAARHGGSIAVDEHFDAGCRIVVAIPVDPAAVAQPRPVSRVA